MTYLKQPKAGFLLLTRQLFSGRVNLNWAAVPGRTSNEFHTCSNTYSLGANSLKRLKFKEIIKPQIEVPIFLLYIWLFGSLIDNSIDNVYNDAQKYQNCKTFVCFKFICDCILFDWIYCNWRRLPLCSGRSYLRIALASHAIVLSCNTSF